MRPVVTILLVAAVLLAGQSSASTDLYTVSLPFSTDEANRNKINANITGPQSVQGNVDSAAKVLMTAIVGYANATTVVQAGVKYPLNATVAFHVVGMIVTSSQAASAAVLATLKAANRLNLNGLNDFRSAVRTQFGLSGDPTLNSLTVEVPCRGTSLFTSTCTDGTAIPDVSFDLRLTTASNADTIRTALCATMQIDACDATSVVVSSDTRSPSVTLKSLGDGMDRLMLLVNAATNRIQSLNALTISKILVTSNDGTLVELYNRGSPSLSDALAAAANTAEEIDCSNSYLGLVCLLLLIPISFRMTQSAYERGKKKGHRETKERLQSAAQEAPPPANVAPSAMQPPPAGPAVATSKLDQPPASRSAPYRPAPQAPSSYQGSAPRNDAPNYAPATDGNASYGSYGGYNDYGDNNYGVNAQQGNGQGGWYDNQAGYDASYGQPSSVNSRQ